MIQNLIKTAKGEFLFMEVPEACVNFIVNMGYLLFNVPAYENWVTDDELANPIKLDKYLKRVEGKDEWKRMALKLPDADFREYQLLGVTKSFVTSKHEASQNITEEVAAQIVGDNGMGCYDNYRLKKDEKYTCSSAISSLNCLLLACDLSPEKPYAILKHIVTPTNK